MSCTKNFNLENSIFDRFMKNKHEQNPNKDQSVKSSRAILLASSSNYNNNL